MSATATIFALATSPGRGGISVFRVSGPGAKLAVKRLCRPGDTPEPREASLRSLHNPQTGELIDRALVLWFENPNSFTGEDVAEFHAHGGRAVAHAVTSALASLPGFRLAEPGEFTRRAFENGKMDLTEAEAIADLVDAETDAQRRQALRQMEGDLGRLYEDWRARLMKALAWLEAAIDFADDDLPKDAAEKQAALLKNLAAEIAQHLDDRHRGERLREGFSVAILGPPNAGKSSLLNALARREAAIVSSIAGTTRDIIEVHLDLGGYPVMLADTAGLRESADLVESEGIRRALSRAGQADLKLLLIDGEKTGQLDEETKKLLDTNAIVVLNKADLAKSHAAPAEIQNPFIALSSKTGEGMEKLLACLIDEIDLRFGGSGPPLTRARHRTALEECAQHLERALTARESALCAEDVRLATRALGRVTGRVDVEDLLDIIFRDFCIGK